MSASHDHPIDIDHHVKVYLRVFLVLLILTVTTVAVSYLEVSTATAIALGMFIATVKASLVACYFMHLISERKLIGYVLILTVLFFSFELLIPLMTDRNNIGMG